MERINEVIDVLVKFEKGRMKLLRFCWNNRWHEVIGTTIRIERVDGGRQFWCFGVETKTMVCELAMEKSNLIWRLVGVAQT